MMQAQANTGELSRPATFDPRKVDRMDDAELDEQPFGVVCLDANGTILRYNLAEARLARLDRNDVIGRHFFEEVAPCTRTDEFEGRFREHVATASPGLTRFGYLFDFKFGAQNVEIELFSVAGTRRHYLLINRLGFAPARADREGRVVAPTQTDLVPVDQEVGVRRDARGQRVFEGGLPLIEGLLKSAERLPAETWNAFAHDWGLQWGRRAIVELETQSLEATELGLRERTVDDAAGAVHDMLRDAGWGELGVDFSSAGRGVVVCRLRHSVFAAASRGPGRRCATVAGLLEASFSHLAGRRLHAAEIACRAEGHGDECELLIVGPARQRRLLAELGERRSVAEWVEVLGRPNDG